MVGAKVGFHVVLSYGDLSRQGGYRTKVLGELFEYERAGELQPFLIVFDRQASQLNESKLQGIPFRAHRRSAVTQYYCDLRDLSQTGPIRIVHAHNLYSGAIALALRPLYKYAVLVELHGRIPEEYVILGKGGAFSHWLLRRLESWVMRNADHIVPISKKLKEYLVAQYQLNPSKLTVIPDCADPVAFRWDPALRQKVRLDLKIEHKFVCIHAGSFSTWYDPKLILATFDRIRAQIPTAHLLIATGDAAAAEHFLSERLDRDAFTVMDVDHERVPALLAASDVGFLLLHPTANIKVASPAKFSEYLNSGLPVLITSEVGDFTQFVLDEKIGTVVSNNGDFDSGFLQGVVDKRQELAARCVSAGQQLTWEAFRPSWANMIGALTAR